MDIGTCCFWAGVCFNDLDYGTALGVFQPNLGDSKITITETIGLGSNITDTIPGSFDTGTGNKYEKIFLYYLCNK
jgi:hypothetical protein